MRKWLMLGAAGLVGLAVVFVYLDRQARLVCLAEDRTLSRDEIVQAALEAAAVDLNLLHRLLEGREEVTVDLPGPVDAEGIMRAQPECCEMTQDVPEEFGAAIERVLQRNEFEALRGYVLVEIDNPEILTVAYSRTSNYYAVDVCGAIIEPF